MIVRRKERLLSAAVFVPAALMVMVLAFVQYRSSNQESEATSYRLADSLQMSMISWHQEVFRNLVHICEISLMHRERADSDLRRYAQSLEEWRAIVRYPDLVANLYVVRWGKGGSELLQYDASDSRLHSVPWSARFETLQTELARAYSLDRANWAATGSHRPTMGVPPITNTYYPVRLSGWEFEPTIPALVYPLKNRDKHGVAMQWIVVELNQGALQNEIFPEVVRRHFQGTDGLDFQVAVIAGNPHRVLYSSDGNFGQQTVLDPDGVVNIFARPVSETSKSPVYVFHQPRAETVQSTPLDLPWFPLLSSQPPSQDWKLIVRHRRGGPLGAFVTDLRRRNLAVSFSVLFLLIASLGMLLISTRRAQSLARLQIDFVTTVSHELRTPLAAISTAADNMARGVVDEKQQMAKYGTLIQAQTHRLSSLIEQVLLFTAMRQGRQRYALRPVDVQEIVTAALTNMTSLPQFSQFTLHTDFDPHLPAVLCDPALLSQCIQNLINNALKYSGNVKWVGVSASYNRDANEVEIRVMDRGIGIAPDDLPHIFDPFFRSDSAVQAQVRGTGIGLALVKNIVDVFHGRLTVKSNPGKGSTFTVHLPCAANEVTA